MLVGDDDNMLQVDHQCTCDDDDDDNDNDDVFQANGRRCLVTSVLPVVLPILVDNDDDDMLRWTPTARVMMMMTYFRRTDGDVRSPV